MIAISCTDFVIFFNINRSGNDRVSLPTKRYQDVFTYVWMNSLREAVPLRREEEEEEGNGMLPPPFSFSLAVRPTLFFISISSSRLSPVSLSIYFFFPSNDVLMPIKRTPAIRMGGGMDGWMDGVGVVGRQIFNAVMMMRWVAGEKKGRDPHPPPLLPLLLCVCVPVVT